MVADKQATDRTELNPKVRTTGTPGILEQTAKVKYHGG
jgi:hypothetical protein